MQHREDSDRLSWALSAIVVLIMGVAVGVASREPAPAPGEGRAKNVGTPSEQTTRHSEAPNHARPGAV